jgi:hypothetical protein
VTAVPSLSETAKGLGPGSYVANIVPSGLLVVGTFALLSSRLFPWMSPDKGAHGVIARGPSSIAHTIGGLGAAGATGLVLAVLVVAVLLRPLQVIGVQLVEGYWGSRGHYGPLETLAVERHARRKSIFEAQSIPFVERADTTSFAAVGQYGRLNHRHERARRRAVRGLESYPPAVRDLMPTRLGNVLRRVEKTAGERYVLDTVTSYPRLYPHLSVRLHELVTNQLDVIDMSGTLVLVFGVLTALSSPLLGRLDPWSLTPIVLALLACISYVGAANAAAEYAEYMNTAYDLHRFDMITALHLPLPADAEQELSDNTRLTAFLGSVGPLKATQRSTWRYVHAASPPAPAEPGQSTIVIGEPAGETETAAEDEAGTAQS